MNLYAISILYMELPIMACSIAQFHHTALIQPDRWLFVDGHWPINGHVSRPHLPSLAAFAGGEIVDPGCNLGGHGAFTWALNQLDLADDDLILNYDLDINPLTLGWGQALHDVLVADSTLGYAALIRQECLNHRDWQFETIAGHRCAFAATDMWAASMFRGSVLRKGLLATSTYYGGVETAMEAHVKKLGLRFCYLYDFHEGPPLIPHPPVYQRYKQDYAGGVYSGTFEDYLRDKFGSGV